MKAGETVLVFTDPISKDSFEGKAKLVKYIQSAPSGQEYWHVRFYRGDDKGKPKLEKETYPRWVTP